MCQQRPIVHLPQPRRIPPHAMCTLCSALLCSAHRSDALSRFHASLAPLRRHDPRGTTARSSARMAPRRAVRRAQRKRYRIRVVGFRATVGRRTQGKASSQDLPGAELVSADAERLKQVRTHRAAAEAVHREQRRNREAAEQRLPGRAGGSHAGKRRKRVCTPGCGNTGG